MYEDDLGNKDNLVWKQVATAAKANGMSLKDTVAEIKKSLDEMLKKQK
jgi:hypothetical protein